MEVEGCPTQGWVLGSAVTCTPPWALAVTIPGRVCPPAVTLLCSVCVFCQHKYVSISDVQIKNEEELEKCPMSLVRRKLLHPISRMKMGGKSILIFTSFPLVLNASLP